MRLRFEARGPGSPKQGGGVLGGTRGFCGNEGPQTEGPRSKGSQPETPKIGGRRSFLVWVHQRGVQARKWPKTVVSFSTTSFSTSYYLPAGPRSVTKAGLWSC